MDKSNDRAGYVPRVKRGHRMPHAVVEAMTRNSMGNVYFSLTDILSKLRRVSPSPLLATGPALTTTASDAGIAP